MPFRGSLRLAVPLLIGGLFLEPSLSKADEGGVSFWLPGQYGSLAATPLQAGWSLTTAYYHTSVDAGANVAFARQVSRGGLTTNLIGNLSANLGADADLVFWGPTYAFATPVLGGQLAIGMTGLFGRNTASADATFTGALGPIGFAISGGTKDAVTGFGDLYPKAELRWSQGAHNVMTYATGGLPVGAYDLRRLANIGIGHGAIDGGVGYTYLNSAAGIEFSAVTGLTYNFTNPKTDYKSGVDWHLDWGASLFLSKQMHVGVVGYFYDQLTADSGAGDKVEAFKSRVVGVGPQVGYSLPVGRNEAYVNFKGYKEFNADNRPDGWNAQLAFAISLGGPSSGGGQTSTPLK